jgi:hypothetical protein
MVGSDEDHGRCRRPSAEDQGWSSTGRVLGSGMIERSSDTVCGLHYAQRDKDHGFLGLASKPRSMVSPNLALESMATGFIVWASKPVAMVWLFEPQNHHDGFLI